MEKETLRASFNKFLKLYLDSCKELYERMNLQELTGKQFRYLRAIEKEKEVPMAFLAERFNLAKPTVTEIIRKFEDNDLIQRKRSESDARVVLISLTEQGKTLANTNQLESAYMVEKLMSKLNDIELNDLKRLFDKIGDVHS